MAICNFSITKLFSLFSAALLVWSPARAQLYTGKLVRSSAASTPIVLEAGFSGGITAYMGDVSSPQRGSLKDAAPIGSVFLRYAVVAGLSARLEVSVGILRGNDAQWIDPEYRRQRNFKFTSPLVEVALIAEYDFLKQRTSGNQASLFGLYPFAGIGFTYTNPDRDFSGFNAAYFGPEDPASKWKQDASAPAPNTALVIPMGIGVSCMVGGNTKFFVEGGYRMSFTDKMDGFSYAVASPDSDGYMIYKAGIAVGLPGLSERLSRN